jgi:hypothetical protein
MSASTYTDIPICNVGFEFRVLLLLFYLNPVVLATLYFPRPSLVCSSFSFGTLHEQLGARFLSLTNIVTMLSPLEIEGFYCKSENHSKKHAESNHHKTSDT